MLPSLKCWSPPDIVHHYALDLSIARSTKKALEVPRLQLACEKGHAAVIEVLCEAKIRSHYG